MNNINIHNRNITESQYQNDSSHGVNIHTRKSDRSQKSIERPSGAEKAAPGKGNDVRWNNKRKQNQEFNNALTFYITIGGEKCQSAATASF